VQIIKKETAKNYHPLVESIFENLGRFTERTSQILNSLILTKWKFPDKPLHEIKIKHHSLTKEQALHKGIEFFFEVLLIYGTLILIGLYEIKKSVKSSRSTMKHFEEVNTKLDRLGGETKTQIEKIKHMQKDLQRMEGRIVSTEETVLGIKREIDKEGKEHQEKEKEKIQSTLKDLQQIHASLELRVLDLEQTLSDSF